MKYSPILFCLIVMFSYSREIKNPQAWTCGLCCFPQSFLLNPNYLTKNLKENYLMSTAKVVGSNGYKRYYLVKY